MFANGQRCILEAGQPAGPFIFLFGINQTCAEMELAGAIPAAAAMMTWMNQINMDRIIPLT
jgi:hypothetical protein